MRLVLASASRRRLELLQRIGLSPDVFAADVDETQLPGEDAADYVLRVATDKAHRVSELILPTASGDDGSRLRVAGDAAPSVGTVGWTVLAADTAVVRDGQPLGKPVDATDAATTLASLSGRSHEVLTAVVVIDSNGIEQSILARARVTFVEISRDEIEWYVATGEPLDKAGSYAIQGIGAVLVETIEGDPSTVIGLPLRETVELLCESGIEWPSRNPRI